jgi:hypothetical protein
VIEWFEDGLLFMGFTFEFFFEFLERECFFFFFFFRILDGIDLAFGGFLGFGFGLDINYRRKKSSFVTLS